MPAKFDAAFRLQNHRPTVLESYDQGRMHFACQESCQVWRTVAIVLPFPRRVRVPATYGKRLHPMVSEAAQMHLVYVAPILHALQSPRLSAGEVCCRFRRPPLGTTSLTLVASFTRRAAESGRARLWALRLASQKWSRFPASGPPTDDFEILQPGSHPYLVAGIGPTTTGSSIHA